MLMRLARAPCAGTKPENTQETENVDMPHHDSAEDLLVIVDFQNVYLPGKPWACPTMEQAMANTVKIVKSPYAPEYVLTRFAAPENPVGCWVTYNGTYADINADAFLCGFPDAIKEIAAEDRVIVKSTYSSMDSQQLLALATGRKRIVLAGVVAECCVLATMMDAMDLGYEVVYLYDCISGCTAEYEQSIRALAEMFSPVHTRVLSSGEYLQQISPEQ